MIRYNTKAPGRKGRRGYTDSVLAYATLTAFDRFVGLPKRIVAFFGLAQDERLLVTTETAGASCRPTAEVILGWI